MSKDETAVLRGAILKRMREDSRPKLTQQRVAELFRVDRVTVSRWETGAAIASRSTVRELVMLYLYRGAKIGPEEAEAADIEIPVKSRDLAPGEISAYPFAPPYPARSTEKVRTIHDLSPEERAQVESDRAQSRAVRESNKGNEMADAVATVVAETGNNIARLAELVGHMRAIGDVMQSVTDSQRKATEKAEGLMREQEQIAGLPISDDLLEQIRTHLRDSASKVPTQEQKAQ